MQYGGRGRGPRPQQQGYQEDHLSYEDGRYPSPQPGMMAGMPMPPSMLMAAPMMPMGAMLPAGLPMPGLMALHLSMHDVTALRMHY